MEFEDIFIATNQPNDDEVDGKYRIRKLLRLISNLTKTKTIDEIGDDEIEVFNGVLSEKVTKDLRGKEIPDNKSEILNLLEAYKSGKSSEGLKSKKFDKISKSLDTFQSGLYVMGGDPNVGKSFTMLNMFIDFLDCNEDSFGILFTIDDRKSIVYERLISISSNGKLEVNDIKKPGEIATKQFSRNGGFDYGSEVYDDCSKKIVDMANERFVVFDSTDISGFDSLQYFIEKLVKRNKGKKIFVMIDGLFNINVDEGSEDARQDNIKRANIIKFIVDFYNIPLFTTVELRKRNHSVGYREPGLDDIMESGKFGYNANLVMMICFDGTKEIEADDVIVKAKFVKNKLSSFRGAHYLKFRRKFGLFSEGATKAEFDAQFDNNDDNPYNMYKKKG